MKFIILFHLNGKCKNISENTGKILLPDLAEVTNRIFCNSQHEALMNMIQSYNESYWPERISDNFLIWFKINKKFFFSMS